MDLWHILGLIILLVGVFLIGFGFRASQTVSNQVMSGFTGRYTRTTMWYLIGGALLVLLGGFLLFYANHMPVNY